MWKRSLRLWQAQRGYAARPAAKEAPAGPSMGFFTPTPAESPLPRVGRLNPASLDLRTTPRHKTPSESLMRCVDVDLRTRHDPDGSRAALFASTSPTRVPLGSVLQVDYVTSRTKPTHQTFAGTLIAVRRKGVGSNFVLRNYVLGTGVEMMFPVYSPMVTSITVLRRSAQEAEPIEAGMSETLEDVGKRTVGSTRVQELVDQAAQQSS